MFINKDLFEKYDVKIPENYDELKEAVIIFNKTISYPSPSTQRLRVPTFTRTLCPWSEGSRIPNPRSQRTGK